MSDDNKPDPKEELDESIEIDGEKYDKDRALAKIKKANSEAAALRKRLQDFEDAEKKAADAKKDELTKAQEATAELQSKLDAAELRATRLEIAIDKKLTVKQANRLTGTTRDELEADADDFLTDLGGAEKSDDKKNPPNRQPRESLRGGGDPTNDEGQEISADKAADQILATNS